MSDTIKRGTESRSRQILISLDDLLALCLAFHADCVRENGQTQGSIEALRSTLPDEGVSDMTSLIETLSIASQDTSITKRERETIDLLLRLGRTSRMDSFTEFDAFIEQDQLRLFLDVLDAEIAASARRPRTMRSDSTSHPVARAIGRMQIVRQVKDMSVDLERIEPEPNTRFN